MGQYTMNMVDGAVVIKDGSLTERYSLSERPQTSSRLVSEERQAILGQINLAKLLDNLDDCVDLLNITYNAVNGMKGLQTSVSDLQMRLAKTLILSNDTVKSFGYKSDSIINKFLDAYGYLLSGDEGYALDLLTEIRDDATQMRIKAEKLSNEFASVADNTQKVLNDTIEHNTQQYEKREEVMAASRRMEAELSAAQELKTKLEENVKSLNEEYNNLLKRQERQEERAFALQLTGAILGALGIAAQSAKDINNERSSGASQDVSAKAKADLDNATKRQDELTAAVEKLKQDIAAKDKELAATDDAERQKQLRDEKVALLKQKEDKEKELEAAKVKTDTFKKAFQEIGDQFTKMGQQMQEYADKYDKKLNEIFQLRSDLQKQERENLVNLQKFTKLIANAVIDKNSLDTAIASLVTAIGCLRKVVSHLMDMVAFWQSIEACCEALASNDTINAVSRIKSKYANTPDTPEALDERVKPYKELMFVRVFLTYLVRWTALNQICSEYLAALEQTRSRLNETIGEKEMDREEHWKKASALASNLNDKLRTQIEKAS